MAELFLDGPDEVGRGPATSSDETCPGVHQSRNTLRELLRCLGVDRSIPNAVREARVGFEAGLERTVAWFLDNRDWLMRKQAEAAAFVEELMKTYKGRQA